VPVLNVGNMRIEDVPDCVVRFRMCCYVAASPPPMCHATRGRHVHMYVLLSIDPAICANTETLPAAKAFLQLCRLYWKSISMKMSSCNMSRHRFAREYFGCGVKVV
jgi:hypothetical protein